MLTKTDFLTFLEAPMHLWAKSHGQLADQPPSLLDQHLSQQGREIETLASQYIEQAIVSQNDQLYWQAAFDDGRYQIRVDALILDQETGEYDLYEIKSSTSIQKTHEYDLTFQYVLLERLLPVRRAYLLLIDKTYLHDQQLDLEAFFILEDLTECIKERKEEVIELRREAWKAAQMPTHGSLLACTKPGSCPCPDLCHPNLPPNPIYNLPYLGKKALPLREMGILAIEDIPSSVQLSPRQHLHAEAIRQGAPIINVQAIRSSLTELQFPLFFLDYETFNPAIPLFPGYRPYEQIVFQYSLFVVEMPGAEPQHYETLITNGSDPAPLIAQNLVNDIGSIGSVVVWNKPFEEGRNQDLARHCPTLADQLLGINDRLFDLMRIFRDGDYVHPHFKGSASLKAVLPVLCPDLGYHDMAIMDSETAMLTWYWLHIGMIPPQDRPKTIEAMKDYCKMDTYGMVAIWDKLRFL